MSTPKPPSGHASGLTFFIDRDLGRHAFPNGLRRAGLVVITLAEHYGIPRDQEVADHEWMLEAARHGWPVLGCDAKHRRRRRAAERALIEAGVQNFILNGNVSALENVERVLHNLAAIRAAFALLRMSNDLRRTGWYRAELRPKLRPRTRHSGKDRERRMGG